MSFTNNAMYDSLCFRHQNIGIHGYKRQPCLPIAPNEVYCNPVTATVATPLQQLL